MYKKILVPLDGSDLAECTMGHVRTIAGGCHVNEVIVLRVADPLSANEAASLSQERGSFGTPGEHTKEVEASFYAHKDYADHVLEKMGQGMAEAESYVSQIAQNLLKDGISAQGVVVTGKAAETIIDYVAQNQIDLIIMSTHGRSGISRWFGSTADRVIRHAATPVLLVTPPGCKMNE